MAGTIRGLKAQGGSGGDEGVIGVGVIGVGAFGDAEISTGKIGDIGGVGGGTRRGSWRRRRGVHHEHGEQVNEVEETHSVQSKPGVMS